MIVRRLWACIVLLGLAAFVVAGCAERGEQAAGRDVIEVKGSNTMLILGQAWAEEFNKTSEAKVTVSGEGSGTGVAALINGTADIAEMSRAMKPEEIERAKAKGVNPVETVVAWDGLAIVVNKDNPVRKLTEGQLRDIYMGNINNWSEFGGPNLEIVAVSRDTSSGTYEYFREHVLRRDNPEGKEEFARTVFLAVSSKQAAQTVSDSKGGIAYVGLGYVTPDVAQVAVAKSQDGPYVQPSIETVQNRTYPLSRPLYFYTGGEPKGAVKDYVEFILSGEGQQIVIRNDFVPMRKL
ncbi:MAG: PstS family phosphate ABC transporter substrate-binding protein [Armatimonadetes bacterium]|nr:PstS family phosphate ABC transporter substrate-binding protein [Armatimonadota bacterium]